MQVERVRIFIVTDEINITIFKNILYNFTCIQKDV